MPNSRRSVDLPGDGGMRTSRGRGFLVVERARETYNRPWPLSTRPQPGAGGRMDRSRAWTPRAIVAGLLFLVIVGAAGPAALADDELDYGLDERRLRELEFSGVEFFDEERLRAQLGLIGAPWYWPFRDPRYRLDRIEQGVEAIRGLYRREGFHEIRVRLDVVESDPDQGDVLRITVD